MHVVCPFCGEGHEVRKTGTKKKTNPDKRFYVRMAQEGVKRGRYFYPLGNGTDSEKTAQSWADDYASDPDYQVYDYKAKQVVPARNKSPGAKSCVRRPEVRHD